jgi:micrococcal nuclease
MSRSPTGQSRRRRIVRRSPVAALGVLAALVAAFVKGPCRPPAPEAPPPNAAVTETVAVVFDGDTFSTSSGARVRILSIDAPEVSTPFADEARDFLKELIDGKPVRLVFDAERTDRYGRTLAHVFAGGAGGEKLVGEELVRRGLACVYIKPPNLLFARERLIPAQRAAVDAGAGIWSVPVTPEARYVVGAYRFHRPSCPFARDIPNPRSASDRRELLREGKNPCRECKP